MDVSHSVHKMPVASPLMDFIYSAAEVLITLRSGGPAVSDTPNIRMGLHLFCRMKVDDVYTCKYVYTCSADTAITAVRGQIAKMDIALRRLDTR